MPIPSIGCVRFFVKFVGVCLLYGTCSVYAESYFPPNEYPIDVTESDSQVSEPEIAATLPEPTDPVSRILQSIVGIETTVREGARTESTFGTDRKGSGVVLDTTGLIATAGYLVAEAETITVIFSNGRRDQADIVAYDDSIGVGLVRTRKYRSTVALELGESSELAKDQNTMILPAAGQSAARAVKIGKISSFTGGWEYVLDNAIHTYPPSTDFSGAALLSDDARLMGIGALVSIDIDIDPKVRVPGNIFIPIDTLKLAMGELLTEGRSKSSLRPWLGVETKDTKSGIKVGAVYEDGPAAVSGIKAGDRIIAINQKRVAKLTDLYTRIWTEHKPGDEIHVLVLRDDQYANVLVATVDRYEWLKLQDADTVTQITELAE